MEIAPLLANLPPFAHTFFEGQAGFLSRYALFSLLFVAIALSIRSLKTETRNWCLIALSLVIVGAFSLPEIALALAAFLAIFYSVVEFVPKGHIRSALLVFLVSCHAIGPIFWLPLLDGYQGMARNFIAFASNLTALRFWGYAWDRSRRAEPERPRFVDYALFMVFFPAFINGPIVTHLEFQERRQDWAWGNGPRRSLVQILSEQRAAILRILFGVALGLATTGLLLTYRDQLLFATLDDPRYAWANALYTYAWWYLSFTAWTEAAIGFGRLCGFDYPENFDAPHNAYGPADFWRRWNITFMVWLRRFIYLPLGGALIRGRDGKRHLEWRNTFAVFGAVAVYHWVGGLKLLGLYWYPWTAVIPWAIWAAMTATAVIATRAMKRPKALGIRGLVIIIATLLFTSVGHMTVMYPPNRSLDGLLQIYRGLLWPF
jgi:D-alanyl-lipoteichoic acid acyltransferase DltB (MBOAT superfamily)